LKWPPKWIGNIYSKLWAEFKNRTFYFEDVKNLTGNTAPNYLSELKKAQALFIFMREKRKRVYRLVPPNLFTWAIANNIDLKWLKQGAYVNIILHILKNLKEKCGGNLLSLGLFGSLARNMARETSDLDFLVIFENLPDSLGERLKLLIRFEDAREIQNEVTFLNENSIFPRFSYHPLQKSELQITPLIIDVSFDMKIIYDTNILENFLFELKKTIKEFDIKRIYLNKNNYYLDLNIPFGQVFEF